jgi:hypothetical protein
MRSIAGEQDAALAPSVGDAGVKGIDDTTFDFDTGEIDVRGDELPDAVVAGKLVGAFARQLHELKTDP